MNAEFGTIGRTWWGFLAVVTGTTILGIVAFLKGVQFGEIFAFYEEIITWALTAVIGGKTIEKFKDSFRKG